MSRTIILKLDKDGTLINPGITIVKVKIFKDVITWEIGEDQAIHSFKLESKYPGKPYPFKKPLSERFKAKVKLRVKDVRSFQDWDYNIIWRKVDTDPVGIKLDPKLVIEPDKAAPTPPLPPVVIIAVVSAVVVAGITLAFKYFNSRLRFRN